MNLCCMILYCGPGDVMRFIPQSLNSISICAKFAVCLLLVGQATTEHPGERWSEVSIGAEMDACDDQSSSYKEPILLQSGGSRKPLDHQHRVIDWQGQTEVT